MGWQDDPVVKPSSGGWQSDSVAGPGALSTLGDVQAGQVKGAGSTFAGLGELVSKIPGVAALENKVLGSAPGAPGLVENSFKDFQDQMAPTNTAQRVGKFANEGAQYAIAGMAEAPAALAALGKASGIPGFLARTLGRATEGAGVGAAQSGGDPKTMTGGAVGSAVAGLVPEVASAMGSVVPAVKRGVTAATDSFLSGKKSLGPAIKAVLAGEPPVELPPIPPPSEIRIAAREAADLATKRMEAQKAAEQIQNAMMRQSAGRTSGITPAEAPIPPAGTVSTTPPPAAVPPPASGSGMPQSPPIMPSMNAAPPEPAMAPPMASGTGMPQNAPLMPSVQMRAPAPRMTAPEPMAAPPSSGAPERGNWTMQTPAQAPVDEIGAMRAEVMRQYAKDPQMQKVLLEALDSGIETKGITTPAPVSRGTIIPDGQRGWPQTHGPVMPKSPGTPPEDVAMMLQKTIDANKASLGAQFSMATPAQKSAIIQAAQSGDFALARKLLTGAEGQ